MKRLFLILILLSSLSCFAQYDFKYKPLNPTPIMDLSVLTGTTAYWMLGDKPQADKIIHFLVGYFSTQAMQCILEPLDLPRGLKITTPILVFTGMALFKEFMLDSSPELLDFKAGMYGLAISALSFNLVYSIPYNHKPLKLR